MFNSFKLLNKHIIPREEESLITWLGKCITGGYVGLMIGIMVGVANKILRVSLMYNDWDKQSAWLMTNGIFGFSIGWTGFWFMVLGVIIPLASLFFELDRQDKANRFLRNLQ